MIQDICDAIRGDDNEMQDILNPANENRDDEGSVIVPAAQLAMDNDMNNYQHDISRLLNAEYENNSVNEVVEDPNPNYQAMLDNALRLPDNIYLSNNNLLHLANATPQQVENEVALALLAQTIAQKLKAEGKDLDNLNLDDMNSGGLEFPLPDSTTEDEEPAPSDPCPSNEELQKHLQSLRERFHKEFPELA